MFCASSMNKRIDCLYYARSALENQAYSARIASEIQASNARLASESCRQRTDDVVAWCRNAVKQASAIISRGKNWYVYSDGAVITINAHSFTVITAHKINARIRVMRNKQSLNME